MDMIEYFINIGFRFLEFRLWFWCSFINKFIREWFVLSFAYFPFLLFVFCLNL